MEFATRFNNKADRPAIVCGKGRTQQNFAKDCDINEIMKRYEKTGLVAHVNRFQGSYGDVTGALDFHSAQNAVIAATEAFMTLPARIRQKFANDPGAFLAFVEDPANEDKMRDMGLLPPAEPLAADPAAAASSVKQDATTKSAASDAGSATKASKGSPTQTSST